MKKQCVLRTKSLILLSVILALGLISGCQKDLLQTEDIVEQDSPALKSAKKNNFMVITKSETLPSGIEKELSAYGKIVKTIPEIGVIVVQPVNGSFESKVAKLSKVKAVVPDLSAMWLEPEKVAEANPPSIGDKEAYFELQWGLDAIDAPEAWNAGYTGKKTRVFILDEGIDADHPDLAPNLNTKLSTSFVPGEDYDIAPGFYFHHGSHVAGIIAGAQNNFGIIGVAPKAEIVAVKVLSEINGSGAFSWINQGIVYAANNGADVINMSLGATFSRNGFYLDENGVLQKIPAAYMQSLIHAMQRAVNYAYKKGAVIVCSAGNGGSNFDGNGAIIKVPAELNNVIAVSATAPNYWYRDLFYGNEANFDIPASYSDFGRSLVSVAAPGGDFDYFNKNGWQYDMILSASSESYYFAAGTSMAAPHVSGVAALIISKYNGKITPQKVTKQILKTADKIDGKGKSLFFGKGRVNAYRAVTE